MSVAELAEGRMVATPLGQHALECRRRHGALQIVEQQRLARRSRIAEASLFSVSSSLCPSVMTAGRVPVAIAPRPGQLALARTRRVRVEQHRRSGIQRRPGERGQGRRCDTGL